MDQKQLRIFSGSAHPELAIEIANILGVPLGQAQTTRFPDSEIRLGQNREQIRSLDYNLQLSLRGYDQVLSRRSSQSQPGQHRH